MIKELWTDISLKNYNKWYPLTGAINDTPEKYINTWQDVNEWFTTFAIRAQNDINAYLNFILYKFPFDSFKDKLIKETLSDMVYVMIEHWVFNRTPIEFNVDATIQFNNGSQFSASSIPTINVWDLAPSRMKILAQLTQLKQLLMSYDEQEIDIEKIDLAAFYTKNQVDELIDNEKAQRISADKDNHDFILTKQMKLYDDVVSENEHEVYRGPVTNLVVKGFIATDYDKEKETAVINFPKEIGTLPPEALQNNPQENDFTHAATADFSAKQQKRITTNENNINLANKEIENIKNNYFNIETSPLWKEVKNENIELFKWYVVSWRMDYDAHNYEFIFLRTTKVFLSVITEAEAVGIFTLDSVYDLLENPEQNGITIAFSMPDKRFTSFGYNYPQQEPNTRATIEKVYQYQGTGTPTEFIEETNNNDNYYTKTETNELLDKKQDINDTDLETDAKTVVGAINEIKNKNVDLKDYYKKEEVDKKLEDTESKFPIAFAINAVGAEIPNLKTIDKTVVGAINEIKNKNVDLKDYYKKEEIDTKLDDDFGYIERKKQDINDTDLETDAKTVVGAINEIKNKNVDLKDYYKKEEVDKKLEDTESKFPIAFAINAVGAEIPNLKTIDKTVAGAINEINAKQPKPSPNNKQWKEVGIRSNNKTIKYKFIVGKKYKVTYIWDGDMQPIAYSISKEFDKLLSNKYDCVYILDSCVRSWNLIDNRIEVLLLEVMDNIIRITTATSIYSGDILKLEELQE